MRLPGSSDLGTDPKVHQAAQQLETLMLRQIVASSKAFSGGSTAGSSVRAGLFADALAEAMMQGGGVGLTEQVENALSGSAAGVISAAAVPSSAALASISSGASGSSLPVAPAPFPGPNMGLQSSSENLARVSSTFGTRSDPFTGQAKQHNGVDFAAAEGTSIPAAAAGVVKSAGPRGGYGNAVEIDHGNGVTTIYGHASEILVKPGQQVTAGETVAKVGHTGRATGSHLHLEVRVKGRPVDPARALKSYSMRADETSGRGP